MPSVPQMDDDDPHRLSILPAIVRHHLDDASTQHTTRKFLVSAPHLNLRLLRRHDDRLAAHLDGVAVAGDDKHTICEVALQSGGAGAAFVTTVQALEDRDRAFLQKLLTLCDTDLSRRSGMLAAFGWIERSQLQGVVRELLLSTSTFERFAGVAACSMHRVDPGLGPARRLEDPDPLVRARAYRAAGELGMREFVSRLGSATRDEDPACQFWAAWSAVLLGDRRDGLEFLRAAALQDGPFRSRAFALALLTMSEQVGHAYLRPLAQDPALLRWLVKGVGIVGDPTYVPWLLRYMEDDRLARLAGESFTLITGLDLSRPPFERARPDNFESGPNDDPADENVAMDEDEGLPWSDVRQVQAWWNQNGGRFAAGVRHFMGAPVKREHCIDVLTNGYQRQRIAAAHHLCLLSPGQTLFEWRAPAWRQQRLLAQMS